MNTTTDLSTRSLLGRARDSVVQDVRTLDAATAHAVVSHVPMAAPTAYVATRTSAPDVTTNPWLGGFGFGEGMSICPTTDGSTKRIHPGRLEAVT